MVPTKVVQKKKRDSMPIQFIPLKFDQRVRKESNPHVTFNFQKKLQQQ